jgi:hypothetical protein
MHRLAQFPAISSPLSASDLDSAPWHSPPQSGNLASDQLSALCAVLAGHTRTMNACWFCLWEGYGWLRDNSAGWIFTARQRGAESMPMPPAPLRPILPPRELLDAPGLHLPGRGYLLFNGPLDAAFELGWTMGEGTFVPQSPNLFWPQDHAWCVASEIDLFCTLVAGSETLAEALVADQRFEAWRVFPSDPVTLDSDEINT